VRSSDPLPGAHDALRLLQKEQIPFILLTNGGGKHEIERLADLSKKLDVQLDQDSIVQSHTPFADLRYLHDKTVLVVGGEYDKCQDVAHKYGFKNVVTPGDIITAHPEIWPFSSVFVDYYKKFARPLPRPINPKDPSNSLKIDAIFVYNDPRDWGLDTTVILDTLMSSQGVLGTLSPKNNNPELPNRGFLQDGQPPLYFSNADLWWAAKYHLPRLGQGGYRESLEGVWAAVTGGERMGVELEKTVIGKPFKETYDFAEKRLRQNRDVMAGGESQVALKKVYMVGDNPESDIRGGNTHKSTFGSEWLSILVRTGVYDGGEPSWKPRVTVDGVYEAVQWAIEDSKK